MTTQVSWKATPLGQFARFIGGVKFAVPVLALAAAAMIWGTWIDSTVGRDAAFRDVYGAPWFVALMGLICASLILSVAVRYPWRRKHVGFIIVHASLVALIAIGFFTMFTKLEGRVILAEGGDPDGYMQMDKEWVQLMEHTNDGHVPIGAGVINDSDEVVIRGDGGKVLATLQILERWPNSEDVQRVVNEASGPLHAVEVLAHPGQSEGTWIPEMRESDPAQPFGDFQLRVMPTGETWVAPVGTASTVLVDPDGAEHPIPEPGAALDDTGWTVTSLEQFRSGTVGGAGEGLRERQGGAANPAAQIVLTHADGSIERQIAYMTMKDAPFVRQLEGETPSGWKLTFRGEALAANTLAIMRDEDGKVHALYADLDGTRETFENDGTWPWQLDIKGQPLVIANDFDRATAVSNVVPRPQEESNIPALVLTSGEGGEQVICRWRRTNQLQVGDETLLLEYGPVMVKLPFAMQLKDFRKMDYPGSDMAMAFESDVVVTPENGQPRDFKIHMNHPYKQDGWKVYQSGFRGDTITILQVTKDPGLVPMYLACTTLCIGILVTFYSRSLSWGHPDIPVPFPPSAEDHVPAGSNAEPTA